MPQESCKSEIVGGGISKNPEKDIQACSLRSSQHLPPPLFTLLSPILVIGLTKQLLLSTVRPFHFFTMPFVQLTISRKVEGRARYRYSPRRGVHRARRATGNWHQGLRPFSCPRWRRAAGPCLRDTARRRRRPKFQHVLYATGSNRGGRGGRRRAGPWRPGSPRTQRPRS